MNKLSLPWQQHVPRWATSLQVSGLLVGWFGQEMTFVCWFSQEMVRRVEKSIVFLLCARYSGRREFVDGALSSVGPYASNELSNSRLAQLRKKSTGGNNKSQLVLKKEPNLGKLVL